MTTDDYVKWRSRKNSVSNQYFHAKYLDIQIKYIFLNSKRDFSHLQEVVVYVRVQIKEFDWQNFGVLERWFLMRGATCEK